MTNRELLELAAKAAGIPEDEAPCYGEDVGIMVRIDGHPLFWNPLKDDGDALRLAVKLNMHLETNLVFAQASVEDADLYTFSESEYVSDEQDIYAATRRVIVRAAAEIGKGM